ncbi:MAG: DUF2341 domain-containing protein [Candidatus Thorarchaeota archaeon]|nr:DUF2341 domain-containing protein [Candidatus Thorarchaeota archaeon]
MSVVVPRSKVVAILAVVISFVFAGQVAAQTALTADQLNAGPSVAILQLSDDKDTDWAVNDLIARLNTFIVDDLFIPDRIRLIKTNAPHVAKSLDNQIIVYMSHGGPIGMVTGNHLTSWKTMARIVMESKASVHLFAACDSRRIVKYGSEDSGKQLYTVPGSRPAEVTNVEITATIMLAFGLDTETVEAYRTAELNKAKDLVQTGISVHIMDFSQIILTEIEQIDANYSQTYTDTHKVYRVAEMVYYALANYTSLPYDLVSLIFAYYRVYDGYPEPGQRQLLAVDITYTKNYYIESEYIPDEGGPYNPEALPPEDPPIDYDSVLYSDLYTSIASYTPGHWENSTPVFTGGTYSGWFKFGGSPSPGWDYIYVNVTASGNVTDQVDSIHLEQLDIGGVRVERTKVDGVWQEPVVDRKPGRTGGLWIDSATVCNYEYDPMWSGEEAKMLSSWQYRKSHLIIHGSGSGEAVVNYPVRIVVNYGSGTDSGENVYLNSRAQTDFDDIRFTDADGYTLLDHWRQSYTESSRAVFWVEIKGSLDRDRTIYIYYGNPSAVSASTGSSVFDFFDDFNRADNSAVGPEWTEDEYGSGTVSISTNRLRIYQAQNYYCHIEKDTPDFHNFVVQAKIMIGSYAGCSWRPNLFVYWGPYDWIGIGPSDYLQHSLEYNYANSIVWGGNAGSVSINTWYYYRIRVTQSYVYPEYSTDGVSWTTHTTLTRYSDWSGPPVLLVVGKGFSQSPSSYPNANLDNCYATPGSYGTSYVDDVFMKKSLSLEPSHSTWGPQEYTQLGSSAQAPWGYRKLHTISGSSGAVPNYPVRIVVHYGSGTDSGEHVYLNSKCQTDFDDIRFTDGTGRVLLDHWRETYAASSQAVFWVEVADSLDTSKNIYVYYGNPAVGSASDGYATFLQFDDFNDNVVSGSWTQSKPVGWIQEAWGSSMVISIGSADNGDWWGGTLEYAPIAYRAAPSTNYAAVTKLNTYSVNLNTHAGIMAYNNRNNAYLWGRYRSASYDEYTLEKIINDVGYWRVAAYSSTTMGTELRIREIGSTRYFDISFNGGSTWSNVYSMTELDPAYLGLFGKEWGSSTLDAIFDFWYVRKCIASEPAHGAWGSEESFSPLGQGSIQVGEDYLYVSGIPTGTGWHGPTFIQELPSYMKLSDFGSFSANVSLLHGGQVQRVGSLNLYLYDDMKRPVFRLSVVDSSSSASSLVVSGAFVSTSGTENSYSWSALGGDYNGIISVRYDPLNGIRLKRSGASEQVLLSINQLTGSHLDRMIKYVGVNCQRYGSNTEHDERIYSIRVSYSGSDFTSFTDRCMSNRSFYQNDGFGVVDVTEDAEDGDTAFWEVYDNVPAGNITNVALDGDRAISLQGGGWDTGYRYPSSGNYWNERNRFVIQWSMKYSEYYEIYISVDTTSGHYYMDYTPQDVDYLGATAGYVHHGLGTTSKDGNWHTFQRDLVADLHEAYPSINIVDINAFLIRGSGYIDDIKLLSYATVKEDAEDGRTTGWGVYSGSGTVSNVLLGTRRVIQLQGSGTSTGHRYPYSSTNYWNDKDHLTIQWSMKYSENYIVYVSVDTSAGHRYLQYTPVDTDGLGTGEYVYFGLGSNTTNGQWWTFKRDLLTDLHRAQPNVDIVDVNAILIRGSGYVDDIMLLTRDSDSQLIAPVGASYLTASVAARPAYNTWHGATFVRALDRPFRLYQLGQFSVRGSLTQTSNSMGQMLIGLFDDQMKQIAWIWWYDDSSGSSTGRMSTAYYPDTEGELRQDSPSTSASFDRTGALWYDRASNSICSAIDGNVVTLGAVTNASRIVSYLVIKVLRYDDVAMVDMRVQDMELVVDLRGTPPWVPTPPPDEAPPNGTGDGTLGGKTDSESSLLGIVQGVFANIAACVHAFFTWPWPELHLCFSQTVLGSSLLIIHIVMDLLGDTHVEEFEIQVLDWNEKPADEGQRTIDIMIASLDDWLRVVAYALALAIGVIYFFLEKWAHFLTLPQEGQFWFAIFAYVLCVLGYFAVTWSLVRSSSLSPMDAAAAFLTMGMMWLLQVWWENRLTKAFMSGKKAGRLYDFFTDVYRKSPLESVRQCGFKGRCHYGLILCNIICLGVLVGLVTGIAIGAW